MKDRRSVSLSSYHRASSTITTSIIIGINTRCWPAMALTLSLLVAGSSAAVTPQGIPEPPQGLGTEYTAASAPGSSTGQNNVNGNGSNASSIGGGNSNSNGLNGIVGNSIVTEDCDPDNVGFELVTGYVYTAPTSLLESIPGSLMLTECLETCQSNDTCKAVNYETGLCVLFSSNADSNPGQFYQYT